MEARLIEDINKFTNSWNPCKSISGESYQYVKDNYTQVDTEDKGEETWIKVRCGFPTMMICIEKKLWRSPDFVEYYR